MWTPRLRSLVAAIGLVVTLVVFVAVPCGFFFIQYENKAGELAYKSELAAARVAKYIYMHQTLWQYQAPRIAELIEIAAVDGKNFAMRVLDSKDTVVARSGPLFSAPMLKRESPLVVSGAVVGRVETAASLRPLLWETVIAFLLSAALAFAVYFAVRVFPVRVLDRTLGKLEAANVRTRESKEQLAVQNERFNAALTHMSQGLVMFDASAKLIVFNQRYIDMFGLSRDIIKHGASLRDVLDHRVATGGFSADEVDGYMASLLASVAEGKPFSKLTTLPDGRIIEIINQPIPGGGWVATHDDITDRLRAEEKIRHLAEYDALTDLPNRVTFYDRMAAVLGHLRRTETIAVLSLDLDNFKSVNDTLGHPIGDRLLQMMAERMRHCVRDNDIVARLGGDEFAVVQVPIDGRQANVTGLAARLIDSVGAPYNIDGQQVVVGVSVGIAIAPTDSDVPDTLMKHADLALYRAKADGGGVYRFFEPEMDARMQARRAMELDLRKAIVNGEFELYYQPIVDVKSSKVTSCEALARWHHPERGMVSPTEFIPLAEETGLIVPLGEWVLRQACAEAARWPDDITIAVNLSPAQCKSRNLVQTVINALASSGLPAGRLELEITELVLLQETEGAFAILHQLRNLGIRIAMDDFGTGYSSLGYLRSFPFDKIKIDQSFIHDLPTKDDSLAIVRAVVGLSSSLGITATAEGVETKEQLDRLTAEGCNEVQGFLFSPPRPAAEIERLIGEQAPRIGAVA